MSYIRDTNIKAQDSPSIDAFARWRVSNPATLFDSKQIHDNQPLFWDDSEVSGGSTTSSHSTATASTTIGVALNTAGKRVRQTFQRFNYQPGKSQLVLLTGTLGTGGGTGITRAMGIFDDNDGIFMQDDEGTIKAVLRSSASGSPVDTKVAQSAWNLDKLDGTGASGVTLDSTKSQIVIIDYEWLGVGRVRIGFVVDGIPIYVHQFLNANNSAGVYMSTPNLPLRYEIENDGTGAASELEHICSSVMSEGGVQNNGYLRHHDSGTVSGLSADGVYAVMGGRLKSTHVDANAADTVYAVIGLRLKTTHLDAVIREVSTTMISETNDDFEWSLYLNPTVAGTFTYSDETNSAVQTATGATANTVTGGTLVNAGFAKSSASISSILPNALHIGAAIDGTRDELVLCVRPLSANADIQASITWRELS